MKSRIYRSFLEALSLCLLASCAVAPTRSERSERNVCVIMRQAPAVIKNQPAPSPEIEAVHQSTNARSLTEAEIDALLLRVYYLDELEKAQGRK